MTAPAGGASPITRRGFLRAAAAGGGALGLSGLLAACGTTAPLPPPGAKAGVAAIDQGPGGLPLARLDAPVTLPIYPDNRPIASGRSPERGPLQLYNWIEYINQDVITSFEHRYGVKVAISTFTTIDEAVAKLQSGSVQFDVFVPEPVFLEQLVVGKLLAPLNLSYIPNLHANVWPELADPWYDRGSRYTVPYTIYTTGIGWRADKLPHFDPASLANPWTALWVQGPKIKGRVGMLDDQHEGLSMGLLRNGVTDLNTQDAAQLTAAQNALEQLVGAANLKFDTNEYQYLADGALWLHQAWSGDMAAAPEYAPKGTPETAFRYWWPTDGRGPINNDMFGVVRGSENPVLAHLFLNHVLETDQAFSNFSYIFYQQPLNAMTPDAVVQRKLIAPNLRNTLIERDQFRHGLVQGPLSTEGNVLWQNAWAAVQS